MRRKPEMGGKELKIVVAGAGRFGREHLRILSGMTGVVIAGVADLNLASARVAADKFGAAGAGVDAVKMIERLRPDGFIVASPGYTHVALTSAALHLGIPVLLEKPVGLSARDAEALIQAEGESRAFVLPGHILRFADAYRTVVDIVHSGDIGAVLSVDLRNHRDDGHAVRYPDIDPVLMTMVHGIDLAIWITGAGLESVLATRRPRGTSRSETLVTAIGRRGSIWRISNAWTYPTRVAPADRATVVCERGSVEMELGTYIRVFGAQTREIDLRPRAAAADDDMLRAEIESFIACINTGTKPDVVTLRDARLGLLAADAIHESLRTETIVHA